MHPCRGWTQISMSGSESDDATVEEESATETELAEYVAQSSTRTAVLTRLVDGPATTSELAQNQAVSIDGATASTASTSATSAESAAEQLYDRDLVELLEMDDLRVYSLTALGESVLFSLNQQDEV